MSEQQTTPEAFEVLLGRYFDVILYTHSRVISNSKALARLLSKVNGTTVEEEEAQMTLDKDQARAELLKIIGKPVDHQKDPADQAS